MTVICKQKQKWAHVGECTMKLTFDSWGNGYQNTACRQCL